MAKGAFCLVEYLSQGHLTDGLQGFGIDPQILHSGDTSQQRQEFVFSLLELSNLAGQSTC